jgi:hypothetical protein
MITKTKIHLLKPFYWFLLFGSITMSIGCRSNSFENKPLDENAITVSVEFKELIAALKSKSNDISYESLQFERINKLPLNEAKKEFDKLKIEHDEFKRVNAEKMENFTKRSKEKKEKNIDATTFNKETIEVETKIIQNSRLSDEYKKYLITELNKPNEKLLLISQKMIKLTQKYPTLREQDGVLKKLMREAIDNSVKSQN